MTLAERLEKIEAMLVVLVERQQVREWYSVEEFARRTVHINLARREIDVSIRVDGETFPAAM